MRKVGYRLQAKRYDRTTIHHDFPALNIWGHRRLPRPRRPNPVAAWGIKSGYAFSLIDRTTFPGRD